MPRRRFRDLLALDRPALGTWTQIAAAETIDILGAAGLDFTIIDCEHGHFGLETAENLIRACDAAGLVPIVRVPPNAPQLVGRALDAGAAAVVAPSVSSVEEMRALVAASRFAPAGTRGSCPCVRAGDHFIRDWKAYAQTQHRELGVIALIESGQGLARVEEICGVEGLLAVMVGPFDLSVSLGREGDYLHPEVQSAILRIARAARARGLPVMAPIFDPDEKKALRQREDWAKHGASMFVVGTDKIFLSEAVRRYASLLAAGGRDGG
jgi:4-hydroxy-2-oxoheptanedioate aldolase